jgi:hypothetical protein
MKPKHFLLDTDGVHYRNRLTLESWYAKKEGKKVPFNKILQELMMEKVASFSSSPCTSPSLCGPFCSGRCQGPIDQSPVDRKGIENAIAQLRRAAKVADPSHQAHWPSCAHCLIEAAIGTLEECLKAEKVAAISPKHP